MKILPALLLISVCTLPAAASAADTINPCVQKRAAIVKQIDQARQRGNDRRVEGLTTALREQEANCTPESLRQARERDVADAQKKVSARERELQQAQRNGKDALAQARQQLGG